jgi:hypothetical protein
MEQAGLPATCGWKRGEDWTQRLGYLETLRDAYVTVVADRDQAGREHARGVYWALQGIAAEVVLVEPAVIKDGGTAADHLERRSSYPGL